MSDNSQEPAITIDTKLLPEEYLVQLMLSVEDGGDLMVDGWLGFNPEGREILPARLTGGELDGVIGPVHRFADQEQAWDWLVQCGATYSFTARYRLAYLDDEAELKEYAGQLNQPAEDSDSIVTDEDFLLEIGGRLAIAGYTIFE